MKYTLTILSIFLSLTIFSQNKNWKEWTKKNEAGIVIEKGFYLHKKQVGVWNYFYIDGSPSLTVNYHNGILNGESSRYDLQGNIIAKLNYKNGKITGNQIYFYPNGNKLSEGKMINAREEGAWRFYNPNGEPMGIVKYKDGVQVDEKTKK